MIPWRRRLLGLVIVATCIRFVSAAEATGGQNDVTWVYPLGGEGFYYLDTVNVTYESPYSDPWMYIFCSVNNSDETTSSPHEVQVQQAEPLNASILIHLNFTCAAPSAPCWFDLRRDKDNSYGSNSPNWILSDQERSSGQATLGLTSTSTATSSASTKVPTSTSSPSTPTQSSTDSGLSMSAKAGLGIGIGLGTSVICVGAFWWYYRYIKLKEHRQEVYRRIVGETHGDASRYVQDEHEINNYHLRYNTPQPASVAGSSHSMASGSVNHDWYPSDVSTGHQYYDPTSHTGTSARASSSSVLRDMNNPPTNIVPEHSVPDAATIRDVADLNQYPNPTSYEPVPATSVPPTRMPSVNYGPNGRLDASTGADFTLLPDYHSTTGPYQLYGPATPPPPPAFTGTRPVPNTLSSQVTFSSFTDSRVAVSELPTTQAYRGYGPEVELPADDQAQALLRHQRSNNNDPEQKFLARDIAHLRKKGP